MAYQEGYQGCQKENKSTNKHDKKVVQVDEEDEDEDKEDSRTESFKKWSNIFVRPIWIMSEIRSSQKKKKVLKSKSEVGHSHSIFIANHNTNLTQINTQIILLK